MNRLSLMEIHADAAYKIDQLSKTDFANFSKLQTNTDVRLFLGGPVDSSKIASKFENHIEAAPPIYHFAIRSPEKELAGLLTLAPHHDLDHIEMSYQLLPEHWGQGLAFYACNQVIDWAFSELNLDALVSETQAKNERSLKLLGRLGMHPIQELERFGERQLIYQKKRDQ